MGEFETLKNLNINMLEDLSSIYGDSFYLIDVDDFRASYESVLNEFRVFYPKTNVAYSYKTNYIPLLCKVVDDIGGYAETVSGMEVDIALTIGVSPEKIFFNGPYKPRQDIEKLLLLGGVVNVDSGADLEAICSIAAARPSSLLRVGLRCNFDIGDGITSRFGFDVQNGDLEAAICELQRHKNVNIIGLHCHFASRSIQAWENAAVGMLEVVRDFKSITGTSPCFVSLGGGLYGEMSEVLQKELKVTPPKFRDYAVAAAKPFAEFYKQEHNTEPLPELLIEPGTALAANALHFAARVINIKFVGNKPIATLAGSSFNVTPNSKNINLPITVHHSTSTVSREYVNLDMGGYTCIESDYLYQNYNGPLSVGDFVVFASAGSYSVVMKPPFIMPNAPILEITEDENIRVIKRQETFEDIFLTYNMDF